MLETGSLLCSRRTTWLNESRCAGLDTNAFFGHADFACRWAPCHDEIEGRVAQKEEDKVKDP